MHRYDEAVEWIKGQNDVEEARKWLASAGKDYGVIHELTHDESLEAVELCYDRGAVKVEVIGESLDDAQNSSADMLLITLPKDPAKRVELFELEQRIAEMSGYQLSVDEGQQYILLRWT